MTLNLTAIDTVMLSAITLAVVYGEFRKYARCAECHHARCHYCERRGGLYVVRHFHPSLIFVGMVSNLRL